jgi:hypothetical protein
MVRRPHRGQIAPSVTAQVADGNPIPARWLGRHTRLSLMIRVDGRVVVLDRLNRRQVADLADTIVRRLRRVAPRHHPRPLAVDAEAYRRRRRHR